MPQITNLYSLSGNSTKESWAVDFADSPTSLSPSSYAAIESQCGWPLFYPEGIPQSWLNKDPGFPVLLRAPLPFKTNAEWLVPPDRYLFCNRNFKPAFEKILIIAHHGADTSEANWHEIETNNAGKEIRWTSYGLTSTPGFPSDKHIPFMHVVLSQGWLPDAFLDLSFWKSDTISPVHLHCLHNGAYFINAHAKPQDYLKSRDLWYGSWIIV